MSLHLAKTKIIAYGLMTCFISSCFHPPYNNFKTDKSLARKTAGGAAIGTAFGAVAAGTGVGALAGAAVGGTIGIAASVSKDTKKSVIKQLDKYHVQYVQYGDTMTLIVPTDIYFMFNSPRLNELAYPGLTNIVKLLKFYPQSPIYVAGFTDDVGPRKNKQLMSQAQAETMLTYLWANGIQAMRLKAEGYGDKNDIGDNNLIHGSAFNRRIEIQWFTGLVAQADMPVMYTK